MSRDSTLYQELLDEYVGTWACIYVHCHQRFQYIFPVACPLNRCQELYHDTNAFTYLQATLFWSACECSPDLGVFTRNETSEHLRFAE